MSDTASTLFEQILLKEIENNNIKIFNDEASLFTFKRFFEADAILCENYKLINYIKSYDQNCLSTNEELR